MNHPLKILAAQLNSIGLINESIRINALVDRSEKRIKLFTNPQYQENVKVLLKELGLSPSYNIEDAVDLLNAADYLSEGANDNNFLLAGFSIASLIPGLQDLKQIAKKPNVPTDSALIIPAAQLIIRQHGMITSVLNKFKDSKLAPYIKYYIPDGELLIQHADRIGQILKTWAVGVNKTPPVIEEAPEEVTDSSNMEAEVDQMLSDLNSQL